MTDRPLSELLRRVGRLVLVTEAGRAAVLVAAALLIAGLSAVFVDAVFGLPTGGLFTVDVLATAVVVAGLAFVVRSVLRHLFDPRRTARRVEQALGLRDNRLINALDLTESPRASSSAALRERAVQSGESLAAQIKAKAAVDFRPLLRTAGWAAAVLAALGVCRLTMPGVFAAVLPRYFDPAGDHPPYTLVEFDVRVSPETALFGKPASISARLGGPETVTQADVVVLQADQRGRLRPGVRLPMLRSHDGEFLLAIEKVEKPLEFYIDTRRGRSRRLTLNMLELPSLERAEVAYRFPKYTGWPATGHPLDSRGLRGLSGTVAEISAQANMPLRAGRLELFREGEEQPHETLELQPRPGDPRTVRGSTPLTHSGRYRLTITSARGAEGTEPLEGKIIVAADRPPAVGILHPEPQLIVVEGYTVPVVVQATDDVGIARIELSAAINGWGPTPVDLETDLREPTVARGIAEFNLPALGAKGGDVITYQARAWDRFPPDGQFAESARHVIQVITEDEYLEYARSEYQMNELLAEFDELQKKLDELDKERDKLLEELESLRKKEKEEGKLSDEDQRRLDELARQLEKLGEQLDKLAKETADRAQQDPLYELEKPFQEMLKELAESLREQARLADKAADALERLRKNPDDKQAQKDLDDALEQLDEEREREQKENEQREELHREMNRLSKVDELIAQGERMEQLIERQRELADRLGEFRGRDSLTPEEQRRADRLAREQERLRQELEQTVDQMEQTAKECQGEAPRTAADAMKLAQAVREMKIGEDQQAAAGQARKGDGRKSHEAAEAAAEKLESLAGKAPTGEAAGEEMEGRGDPGLKLSRSGLGQSMKQLSQGRKMPGLRGMGQAHGMKPGQAKGAKPGEGNGVRGSMARQTVLGPHAPLGDKSKPRQGQQGNEGPSDALAERRAPDGREAESLTPEGRPNQRSAAGSLRGVPAPFRDQAEKYFRRLAEGK